MENISEQTVKAFDIEEIRSQFPILNQTVNNKPLVYFDNAATNQKPQRVIDSLVDYYSGFNANIHRGIHTLAEKATSEFENTREAVQRYINAAEKEEVIFTYGTTDGINLVAETFGKANVKQGDEIIISTMEHHSNIVPWQMLCEEKGAKLIVIPINDKGELLLDEFENLLSERTKIVSLVYASNSLGTINPVKEVISKAHKYGAKVLLDGAQASAHLKIDVQKLDADFYVLSSHKMYGPTGVGILYGKSSLLEDMPPYRGGGEMIREVTFEKTTYNDIPYKFEAGTPNIADVVALKKAIEFVEEYGIEQIGEYEDEVLKYATEALRPIHGLRIIGEANEKVSVLSFYVEGVHHFDIGQIMDSQGIAVRTGHHCTEPLMNRFGIEGTVRASFSAYNTIEEVDKMKQSLERVISFLRK
ncbi:MAG: cysteine desulfurase [Bacteroidota bacterium]